jgi:hypothetical protein
MIAGNHAEFIQLYNDFKDSKTWQELQFSNADFASMIGISPRALYRWKSGEVPIPLTAIFLLRLLVKQEKEARRELA